MVQNKVKISELGGNLPWGAKKEISNRTGISPNTVSKLFNGESVRYDKSMKIIDAANAIIAEIRNKIQ